MTTTVTLEFVRGDLSSEGIKWHVPHPKTKLPLCGKRLKGSELFTSTVDVNDKEVCRDCWLNAYIVGVLKKDKGEKQ